MQEFNITYCSLKRMQYYYMHVVILALRPKLQQEMFTIFTLEHCTRSDIEVTNAALKHSENQ